VTIIIVPKRDKKERGKKLRNFVVLLFPRYYSGAYVMEDMMGKVCGMYGEKINITWFWWENLYGETSSKNWS
jgi:hypothetical protein